MEMLVTSSRKMLGFYTPLCCSVTIEANYKNTDFATTQTTLFLPYTTAKSCQFLQSVLVYLTNVLIVDLCSRFKQCYTYGDVLGDI